MSNGSDRSDDSDGIPDDLDAFLGELGVGDESDGSEDHGSPIYHYHLPNSGSSGSLVDSPLLASLGIDLGDIDGGSDSSDDDLDSQDSSDVAIDATAAALSAALDEQRRQAKQESSLSAMLHDSSDDESEHYVEPDHIPNATNIVPVQTNARGGSDTRGDAIVRELDALAGLQAGNKNGGSHVGEKKSSQEALSGAGRAADHETFDRLDVLSPELLETIREGAAIAVQIRAGDRSAVQDNCSPDLKSTTASSSWSSRNPLKQASDAMQRLQASKGARILSPFRAWFASFMTEPGDLVSEAKRSRGTDASSLYVVYPTGELCPVPHSANSIDNRGWLRRGGHSSDDYDGVSSLDPEYDAGAAVDPVVSSGIVSSNVLRDVGAVLGRMNTQKTPGERYYRRYGRILCSASSSRLFAVGTSGGFVLIFSWHGMGKRQWDRLKQLREAQSVDRSQAVEPIDLPGLCFSGEIDLRPRGAVPASPASSTVTAVALSRDGDELAAGFASGEVRLVSLRIQTISGSSSVFRRGATRRRDNAPSVVVDVAGRPRASVTDNHSGYILTLYFTHDGPDSSFDDCGSGLLATAKDPASETKVLPEILAMCDGGTLTLYKLHESFLGSATLHPRSLLDGRTRMRGASFTPSHVETFPAVWEIYRSVMAESRGIPLRPLRYMAQSGWLVATHSLDSTFVFRSRPSFEVQLKWDRPAGISPLFAPSLAWGFAFAAYLSSAAGLRASYPPDGSVYTVLRSGDACTSSPVLTMARAWGSCIELVQVQPCGGFAKHGEERAPSRLLPGADSAAAAGSRAFGTGRELEGGNLQFLLCAELRLDEPVVAVEWLSSTKLLVASIGDLAVVDTRTMEVVERYNLGGLYLCSRPLPYPTSMRSRVLYEALQSASASSGADSTRVSVSNVFEGTAADASLALALAHTTFSGSLVKGRSSPVVAWGSTPSLDGSRNYVLVVGTDSCALLTLQSIMTRCRNLISSGDSIGSMALALWYIRRARHETRARQRLAERVVRASRSIGAATGSHPVFPKLPETSLDFGTVALANEVLVNACHAGLEAIAASKPSTFSSEKNELIIAAKSASGLASGRPSPHPCSALARSAIDFAVAVECVQPDGVLFQRVYEAFDSNGWSSLFLVELEPYILHNSIRGMPAAVVVYWIELYRSMGRGDILERCLLHLSANSHMDINLLVKVCVRLGLWAALVVVLAEVMRSGTAACDLLLVAAAPIMKSENPSKYWYGASSGSGAIDEIESATSSIHNRARLVLLHFVRQTLDAAPFRAIEAGLLNVTIAATPAKTTHVYQHTNDIESFRADLLASLCSSASDSTFPDIDEALLASIHSSDSSTAGNTQYSRVSTPESEVVATSSSRGTGAQATAQSASYERVLASFEVSIRELQSLPGPFKRLQSCLLLDCRGSFRALQQAILPRDAPQKMQSAIDAVSLSQHQSNFPSELVQYKPVCSGKDLLSDYDMFAWESKCLNATNMSELDLDNDSRREVSTDDADHQRGWTDNGTALSASQLEGVDFDLLPFEIATTTSEQFTDMRFSSYEYLWRIVSRSSQSKQDEPRGSLDMKGPSFNVVFKSLADAGIALCSNTNVFSGRHTWTGMHSPSGLATQCLRVDDEDDFVCGLAVAIAWRTRGLGFIQKAELHSIGADSELLQALAAYLAFTASCCRRGVDCLEGIASSESLERLRAILPQLQRASAHNREALLCDLLVCNPSMHNDDKLRAICKAGKLHRASLLLAFYSKDVSQCVQAYCNTDYKWRNRVFGFVRKWLWETILGVSSALADQDRVRSLLQTEAPGSDAYGRLSRYYTEAKQQKLAAQKNEVAAREAILSHLAALVEVSPRETTRLIVGLYPGERDSILQVLGENYRLRFLQELLQAQKTASRQSEPRGNDDASTVHRETLQRETLLGHKGVAELLQMQDAIELTRDLHPRYLRLLCRLRPGEVRAYLEQEMEQSGMPSHTALEIVSEQGVPDAIAFLYRGRGRRPDGLKVLLYDIEASILRLVESARSRMAAGVGTRDSSSTASAEYSYSDHSDALTVGFPSYYTKRALLEADACLNSESALIQRLKQASDYAIQLCREGSEVGSEESGRALWFSLLDAMTNLSRAASDAGYVTKSPGERTAQLAAFRSVADRLRDVLSGMQECLQLHVVLNKVLAEHGDAPFEQYRQLVSSIVSSARYDENQLRFASDLVRSDAKDAAVQLFRLLRGGDTASSSSTASLTEARPEFLQSMADQRAYSMGSRGVRSRAQNWLALTSAQSQQLSHQSPMPSTVGHDQSPRSLAWRLAIYRKTGKTRFKIESEQSVVESKASKSGLYSEGGALALHARFNQINSMAISQGSLGVPSIQLGISAYKGSHSSQGLKRVRERGPTNAAQRDLDSDDSDAEQDKRHIEQHRGPPRTSISLRKDVSEFGRTQAAQRLMRSRAARDAGGGVSGAESHSFGGSDRGAVQHAQLLDSVYRVALAQAAPSGVVGNRNRSVNFQVYASVPCIDDADRDGGSVPTRFTPAANASTAMVYTSAITAVDFSQARVFMQSPE